MRAFVSGPIGRFALIAGVLVAAFGAIAAKPPGAEEILAKLGLMDGKLSAIQTSQSSLGTQVQGVNAALAALAAREDQIRVEIDVSENACVGVSVQCTSFHSIDPASSANHNPVAIRLFVTRNGNPVYGLTASRFFLDFNGAPAAGPGLERCDNGDGECSAFGGDFQDFGSGLYVIWVHPFFEPPAAPTWKVGAYPMVATVQDADGKAGVGYGAIEITE